MSVGTLRQCAHCHMPLGTVPAQNGPHCGRSMPLASLYTTLYYIRVTLPFLLSLRPQGTLPEELRGSRKPSTGEEAGTGP